MKLIKTLFLVLLILCLAASMAMAANTTVRVGKFINIIPDGSTNWDITTATGDEAGVTLVSIAFYPSAANDVLVVRDNGLNGPIIFSGKDTVGGGLIIYFDNTQCKPFIKASECTFGTPANVRIIMTTR